MAANPFTETSNDLGEERISLSDLEQVRQWAVRLGISQEQLRKLVAQVGPRVADLQRRVNQPELLD
jgi:hypothetical protein